jgi:molecular chaperone GrpE
LNAPPLAQYKSVERQPFSLMSEPEPQADKVPPEASGQDANASQSAGDAPEDAQREALLRALADADNARKRAQAEIAQARKFAAERVVEDLLPVMDSLEAALSQGNEAAEAILAGVEVTRKQLAGALERAGVGLISAEPGQRFDPHRHQAMAAVESDQEPNTVVAVLQKGYALHDRVVRPALVTVAKARTVENPA